MRRHWSLTLDEATADILRHPTKRRPRKRPAAPAPLLAPYCPILDARCDSHEPRDGIGFLSCRLPKAGLIRDATTLIQNAFSSARGNVNYQVLTAEDYPPTGDISCKICAAVAKSSFVLVELSGYSPSVAMELGFCLARGIPTYLLFNQEEQREVDEPFSSVEYFSYSVTPDGVEQLVERQILPALRGGDGRRSLALGPSLSEVSEAQSDVFVALPDEPYCRETLLPVIGAALKEDGLKATTEYQGRALQDLQRAAIGIAKSKYCLIDTTHGNPVRAMYLGMALGYGKPFANLINRSHDRRAAIFTNARSKSAFEYRDGSELAAAVAEFLARVRGDR